MGACGVQMKLHDELQSETKSGAKASLLPSLLPSVSLFFFRIPSHKFCNETSWNREATGLQQLKALFIQADRLLTIFLSFGNGIFFGKKKHC
jgi:hypothetical protein